MAVRLRNQFRQNRGSWATAIKPRRDVVATPRKSSGQALDVDTYLMWTPDVRHRAEA